MNREEKFFDYIITCKKCGGTVKFKGRLENWVCLCGNKRWIEFKKI